MISQTNHTSDLNEALRAAFDTNGVGLESAEGGGIAVYDYLEAALAAA